MGNEITIFVKVPQFLTLISEHDVYIYTWTCKMYVVFSIDTESHGQSIVELLYLFCKR